MLHTDDPVHTKGYGLTFTLGRGNEVVAACVKALEHHLIGADFDKDILANMMDAEDHRGFYYRLCQDGQLRWIGPEKGAIAMACGAIMNAVWDLMARRKEKPLWLFIAEMPPAQLVELIDFKHIEDFVTKEEALALLQKVRPGWQKRVEHMKSVGFRAYTTSCGWLGYSEEVVRQKCRESLAEGHQHFKMKVGSKNVADDVERAGWIREEIGPTRMLMMDANQKWNVDEAVKNMKILAQTPFRPIWIEEPTNCDDVVGHATVARALEKVENGVCGVATGEACSNKVLFKQLLQLKAIRYCQIDACRVAGVNEILAILLMSAKAGVKVCPHAGGVGLCEYVRHLCMVDFICFNPTDEKDRVCESITDGKGYFYDPIKFNKRKDGLYYLPALAPGYAQFKEQVLDEYLFPHGPVWRHEEKGQKVIKEMVEHAKIVLERNGQGWNGRSAITTATVQVALVAAAAAAAVVGWSFMRKH